MKYFSVSFISQKSDVPKKKFFLDLSFLQNPATVMKIILALVFAVFMFIMGDASVALFMLISFLIIPLVASNIYHFSYVKSVYKSKSSKRPIVVDFYADHIVYNLMNNSDYKGVSVRHLGFDKLENILDFEDVFIFVFKNEGGVNIPKRAMTGDEIAMIYNLVDNLFKNKYIKMK